MKTVIHALVLPLVLLNTVRPSAAQSADEIVERHLAASGGRAALEKLTSRSLSGTITLTTPAGDLSGPIEILHATPARERILITLDLTALGAGTLTVDRRFDGTIGFVIDTLQGDPTSPGSSCRTCAMTRPHSRTRSWPTSRLARH